MTEYRCSNCNFVSGYKNSAVKHTRLVCHCFKIIVKIVPEKCEDCGKIYKDIKTFKAHLKQCSKIIVSTEAQLEKLKAVVQKQNVRIKEMKNEILRLRSKVYYWSNKNQNKLKIEREKSHSNEIFKKVMSQLLKESKKRTEKELKKESKKRTEKELKKESKPRPVFNECSFFVEF
jgi:predicted RNase H-like nuclease (RuvC/YqgF family)